MINCALSRRCNSFPLTDTCHTLGEGADRGRILAVAWDETLSLTRHDKVDLKVEH